MSPSPHPPSPASPLTDAAAAPTSPLSAAAIRPQPPATREAALARLQAFLPRAGRAYLRDRGTDLGPAQRDTVSVLSPYLRHRLLTEREAVAAALAVHGPRDAGKWVQEVLWRTYWKGWLELRPALWPQWCAARDVARQRLAGDPGLGARVADARAGRTGIDGYDDWARELASTGWLHNHARMWVASIWIFTLRLPWELGADWFLQELLDADPASNTLSWRWVAGLQTPGKVYLADAGNIARHTGGRFHPRGLATAATAVAGPPPPPPGALPTADSVAPTLPTLLLVTAEDLHPESLDACLGDVRAVQVASGADGEAAWPWGAAARGFVATAADDAATRAARHVGCSASVVPAIAADALLAAAAAAGARAIVTAWAPVGPVADALARLAPACAAAGVPLLRVRRGWDSACWPHATRGFFPFHDKAPELLRATGVLPAAASTC